MRRAFHGMTGAALVALACFFISSPALGDGAIGDSRVSPTGHVASYKVKFGYVSEAAFLAAKKTDCGKQGVACDSFIEGDFFYDMTANLFKVYNGAAWVPYAPAGGAGQTLGDAYLNGPIIARTAGVGSIQVNDATNDAQPTLDMNRTAGAGPVIDIHNVGTGKDVNADAWSVSKAGLAVLTGIDMASDKPIRLGSGQEFSLEWDTAANPDGVLLSAAVDTPFYLCSDATGCDFFLFSGAAGDLVQWDASAKRMVFTDTGLRLGESDPVEFGATGLWSIRGTDAGALVIAGDTDMAVNVGVDGSGQNVKLFGDTAGKYSLWDQSADAQIFNAAAVQLTNSTPLVFGTAGGITGELAFTFEGHPLHRLAISQTATVDEVQIIWGKDDDGIEQTFYLDTAGSKLQVNVANDELLATAAKIRIDDTSKFLIGTGATANGDMAFDYVGGVTNVMGLHQIAPGTGTFELGVDGKGVTTTLHSETAGDFWKFDQTSEVLEFEDVNAAFSDGANLYMGPTSLTTPADGFSISGTAAGLSVNAVVVGGAGSPTVNVGNVTDTNFKLNSTAGSCANDFGANTLTCDGENFRLLDDDLQQFGDSQDVSLAWDTATVLPAGAAAALHVTQAAANSSVAWGVDSAGMNQYWFGDVAGRYLSWAQGTNELLTTNANVRFSDGTAGLGEGADALVFGAGSDAGLYWADGTSTLTLEAKAASAFDIGLLAGPYFNMNWYGTGGANYVTFNSTAAPYAKHVGVPLDLDATSPLMLHVAAPTAPADGIVVDPTSATEARVYSGTVAGGKFTFGLNHAAAKSNLDVEINTATGTLFSDHSTNIITATGVDLNMADLAKVGFGAGGGAGPDVVLKWDTVPGTDVLAMDTSGDADAIFQIGTSAASHKIVTLFGDTTTGVSVSPAVATPSVTLVGTARYPEYVHLTAGEFVPTSSNTAWDASNASAGWGFTEGAGVDDAVQTYWQPPKWVDTSVDITAYLLFSCAGPGNVGWTLNYAKVTAAVTLTNAAGTDSAVTAACAVANEFYETNATPFTIDEGSVATTGYKPLRLTVKRVDDTDASSSDCVFYGLMLEVTRAYMD